MALRLLVVDDEPVLRKTFEYYLGGHGYGVDTAENGKQALELCKQSRYDLVITDLCMPEMDGNTMIEMLRKGDMSMPIIAMSAMVGASGRQETLSLGAMCCITKPVDLAELEHLIKNMTTPGVA